MSTLPGNTPPRPRSSLLISSAISTVVGFGFLLGYHLRTMEAIPESWLLFLGVLGPFCALLYRINYLEQRVARLEHGSVGESADTPSRFENRGVAGQVLKLPNAESLLSLSPGEQFIGLVTLLAVKHGADRIRFARESGVWSISIGEGEAKQDIIPMYEAFPLRRLVRRLSRHRGWAYFFAPWSLAPESGGFSLILDGGASVRCMASERDGGEVIMLSLSPTGPAADQSSELLRAFEHLRCPDKPEVEP